MTNPPRSRFTVTFIPMSGIDGIRALRWLLKRARRQYGLICTDVKEEPARTNTLNQVGDALVKLHHDVVARTRGRS
jgi:hypothetical protein